jgi:transposase-like protein
MAKKRKTYSREFKVETVKLITKQGESVSQVALDMGIHENTSTSGSETFQPNLRRHSQAKGIWSLKPRSCAGSRKKTSG